MANLNNLRCLIEALRSGKYKQTFNQLRNGDCFCAEGVACEVYRQQTSQAAWEGDTFLILDELAGEQYWGAVMPPRVNEWLGVNHEFVKYQGETRNLISLNDRYQLSFAEIADLLERQCFASDKENYGTK